jgi:uncharacterized protein YjbI with pentapeptide repeats
MIITATVIGLFILSHFVIKYWRERKKLATKIEIKSIRGEVLFTCNAKSLREAVITAVRAGVDLFGASLFNADLSGIDLPGADLSDTDLSDANLSNADLSWAKLSYAILSNANLSGANLSHVNFTGANLSHANLSNANLFRAIFSSASTLDEELSNAELSCSESPNAILSDANLSGADLSRADLSGVHLSCANLSHANLSQADLSGADLSQADLSGVDLTGANLSYAILWGTKNIPDLAAARTSIVPETGAFEAWKKCAHGVLVRLRIPAHAARSNATGRKCRASEAEVLEIIGADEARSYDDNFVYRVGETVKADKWNPDRWIECGDGIHFFLTRAEAEDD